MADGGIWIMIDLPVFSGERPCLNRSLARFFSDGEPAIAIREWRDRAATAPIPLTGKNIEAALAMWNDGTVLHETWTGSA